MNTKYLIGLCAAGLLVACGNRDDGKASATVPANDPATSTPGAGDTATTPGGNAGDPSTTPPSTTSSPEAPPAESPPGG